MPTQDRLGRHQDLIELKADVQKGFISQVTGYRFPCKCCKKNHHFISSQKCVTPLHKAAASGHWRARAVIDILLSAKAEVNARDHEGKTPLMHAAAIVEPRLLSRGRPRPRTRASKMASLRALLMAKSDVDAVDKSGATALTISIGNYGPSSGSSLRMLLDAGADIYRGKLTNEMTALEYLEQTPVGAPKQLGSQPDGSNGQNTKTEMRQRAKYSILLAAIEGRQRNALFGLRLQFAGIPTIGLNPADASRWPYDAMTDG